MVDLINEIQSFRSTVDVYDPIASKKEIINESEIHLIDKPNKGRYDLIIIAVGHREFKKLGGSKIRVW